MATRIILDTDTEASVSVRRGGSDGLVIYPDIMGLRSLFDDHVDRISQELSWPVVCVEMFAGQTQLSLEDRLQTAKNLSDTAKLDDANAAAQVLGCERVSIMGFCMGGMYALKAAPHWRRAVSFYPMISLPPMWRSESQQEPLEILKDNGANVLAIVGTADTFISPEDVEALKHTGAKVVVYDGAEHGFAHDSSREAHRPEDAADAFSRAFDFLRGK